MDSYAYHGMPDSTEGIVLFVVGRVAWPGLHQLPAGASVIEAIAAAGGYLVDADPTRVILARGREIRELDLRSFRRQQDDVLRGSDVIVVFSSVTQEK